MPYIYNNGCLSWNDYFTNTYCEDNNNEQNKLMKITSMVKRLLDKDTKTLVKAGFINGNLELTEEGRNSLMAIMFDKFKPELVKEAEEKIAEEKSK